MQKKTKIFLLAALLLLIAVLGGVAVLSQNKAEKEAGAVFVREAVYAENRV